ncbi:MAG: T9SS type A sorting domain-containing protein [Bacteroidales bacterium]|nr:T9SS type A sorting domain-containing protein [Bacteroidales bacterium]
MKRILKAFAVIICMMLCTYAYTQTLTVKFTGRDQTGQHYVKLDHVKTFNLDQLWEEVLYFPDTTLVLGGVGIIDYGNPSNSQLEQNIPNPFNGTTHFTLYLREGADALLEIFDLMGKTVISQYYANLSAGAHLFSANLTNPQVYILKVTVKNEQMHLKLVNNGHGAENSICHVSASFQNGEFESGAKNGQAMGIYPFHNGDELQHTGYTVINGVEYKSETITQRQNESETLILPFNLTPTVITNEVSNITSSSAVCGGNVNYTGEAMIVNKGICWSTAIGPTINENHTSVGAGTGDFTSIMTNLNPGTTYYVRAYATSSANTTGYGEQVTFNTLTFPSVTTSMVSNITDNFATCGGNVTFDGGATVTAGVCWSTTQTPTIADNHTNDGSGTGIFTSIITGLVPNTTYYVRAYATNSVGTAYGNEVCFTTTHYGQPCPGSATVTDIDNNTYNTVQIGNQCWMKENLRTTRYSNGTSIALGSWTSSASSYRYYPNNDQSNVSTYGYLYNWKAVMGNSSSSNENPSGVQGICPTGWHVPSDAEWTQLTDYVSSQSQYVCGSSNTNIAKAMASTAGWSSSTNTCAVCNDPSANNAAGFSALPAGYYDGNHSYFGLGAWFWSSKDNYEFAYNDCAYYRCLHCSGGFVDIYYHKKYSGYSVRCVRNEGSSPTTQLPTITTSATSNIAETTATCGGNVTSDGGATVTARGVCWSTSQNPTISDSHTNNGSGIGSFTSNITGLIAGTSYYVRAYAINSAGTAYGEQQNFTTSLSVSLPTVSTNTVSNITNITASCGGNVTSDGGATVTARGVCWSTSQNPTINDSHTTNGSGTGSFTSNLTGLTAGIPYYVRAYATNSAGTIYGNVVSFTTNSSYGLACPGVATVTDIDNNTYNTVQIGNQCWMKENLRTTRYSNGSSIVLESSTSTMTAYRYYPDNDSSNVATYGYLYNWKAVMGNSSSSSANPSGVQGVCPTGWHVPSNAEWTQFTDYVSSQNQYVCSDNNNYIAKALTSAIGWDSNSYTCSVGNNQTSNNTTGFSAFPAGNYGAYWGGPNSFNREACFSSSTTNSYGNAAYVRVLSYDGASVQTDGSYLHRGISVRCVRN